jgi:hypothetical protein
MTAHAMVELGEGRTKKRDLIAREQTTMPPPTLARNRRLWHLADIPVSTNFADATREAVSAY